MNLIERQKELVNSLLNYEMEHEIYHIKNKYLYNKKMYNDLLATIQNEKKLNEMLENLRELVEDFSLYSVINKKNKFNEDMYRKSLKIFNEVSEYKKDLKDMEKGRVI